MIKSLEVIFFSLFVLSCLLFMSFFIKPNWFSANLMYPEKKIENILEQRESFTNNVYKIEDFEVKSFQISSLNNNEEAQKYLYFIVGSGIIFFVLFIISRRKRLSLY